MDVCIIPHGPWFDIFFASLIDSRLVLLVYCHLFACVYPLCTMSSCNLICLKTIPSRHVCTKMKWNTNMSVCVRVSLNRFHKHKWIAYFETTKIVNPKLKTIRVFCFVFPSFSVWFSCLVVPGILKNRSQAELIIFQLRSYCIIVLMHLLFAQCNNNQHYCQSLLIPCIIQLKREEFSTRRTMTFNPI